MAWAGSTIIEPIHSQGDILGMSKGYGTGLVPRDESLDPYGSFFDKPAPPIPRSEWKTRIQESESKGRVVSNHLLANGWKIKHQGSTNLCWAFATVECMEATRIIGGEPYLSLSPASVGGPITGYVDVGGWPTKAARFLSETGAAPSALWQDKTIKKSLNTELARASRERHRASEWFDLPRGSFDHVFSELLRKRPVACGVPWWKHAVKFLDPMWSPKYGFMVRFANSWGTGWGTNGFGVLTEKECVIGDATCLRVVDAT